MARKKRRKLDSNHTCLLIRTDGKVLKEFYIRDFEDIKDYKLYDKSMHVIIWYNRKGKKITNKQWNY